MATARGWWRSLEQNEKTAAAITIVAWFFLFANPLGKLISDWWHNPDAGHGLLLAPLALYLAWRRGLIRNPNPQIRIGLFLLAASVALRYAAGLAAELYTLRMSMLGTVFALVILYAGLQQLRVWWLPVALLVLSIPLPFIVLSAIALPLQLIASEFGTALLEWRDVPVLLSGNVIHLPGRTLFVTEACSGLRSLTALIALSVLIGGVWLQSVPGRIALVVAAVPVAIVLNGVRVFLTGFLVFFASPEFGEGFLHLTEGWAIFTVACLVLGAGAFLVSKTEQLVRTRHA